MIQASFRLFRCPTLHAEHNIARGFLTNNFYNLCPVDYAVTTSTTHWCTSYLATFSFGMFYRDVLGVQVHQPFSNTIEPSVHILAR